MAGARKALKVIGRVDQPATLPPDIELRQLWAKQRIEELSAKPPTYSVHAYSSRRTTHIIFKNGYLAVEGGERCKPYAPSVMAENLVASVRAYRDTVPAPQLLVWRCEPEFTLDEHGDWNLYARLCFETAETLAA